MEKKINTLIFDLDGTLGETLPLCIEAFHRSIEPLVGRHVSDKEIIDTFGPSEEGTIMSLAPEYYEQGVRDYLYHYEQLHPVICPKPFEGIKELLEKLIDKGVHVTMVTGKGAKSCKITMALCKCKTTLKL
ncbi:hypothetical protein RCZ04_15220 [Capnocytophaga sp. HP1101]